MTTKYNQWSPSSPLTRLCRLSLLHLIQDSYCGRLVFSQASQTRIRTQYEVNTVAAKGEWSLTVPLDWSISQSYISRRIGISPLQSALQSCMQGVIQNSGADFLRRSVCSEAGFEILLYQKSHLLCYSHGYWIGDWILTLQLIGTIQTSESPPRVVCSVIQMIQLLNDPMPMPDNSNHSNELNHSKAY
jgi:hypothetical protein